jgi:hypothetical protein
MLLTPSNFFFKLFITICKIEDEYVPLLFNIVENHFDSIRKLKQNKNSRLRSSVIPIYKVNQLIRQCSTSLELCKEEIEAEKISKTKLTFRMVANIIYETIKLQRLIINTRKEKSLIKQTKTFKRLVNEFEKKSLELAPEIDGRIVCIS